MYLIDTNVISEIRKIRFGSANKNVAKWADDVDARELYLSVITVEELEIGVLLLKRRDPKQGAVLRAWLDHQVFPAFEGRILEIDMAIVLRSAHLHVPNPKPLRDGLIAATALVHSMTVVTRNVEDFKMAGVKIFDPWQ
ncbi:type II toxin-antitoxin system VapC family toxin [Polynucleobacter sp. IMCC 30228]|uniref:type II toxin-antitoxin system VapC family toxin n=1 Tax=Polynucleobacter sp. IMCC 30228 TaxID=2781011 RepID=UPI001F41CBAC|nr:type II toxin-antitoxin system VapC family toxin [Polynucleobacter sp. IMCC 30228]MCE7527103.1 type II toxin-antitoxin system VapC family toxin [Polynucleobacter sp. IMCC 30228]